MPARGKGTLDLFPDLEAGKVQSSLEFDENLRGQGYALVAGVDEVGRGPLAGPVVAAAVILEAGLEYPGVGDSKKLTAPARERAFWFILRRARAVSLGLVDQKEIDRTNILRASLKAMVQAVSALKPPPDYLLVDGNFPLPLSLPQQAVVHGDSRSLSIGAASIVAKVVRDRMMTAYDRQYPEYSFAAHKGYGTKEHLKALELCGPCPLHRLTFKGTLGSNEHEPAS